MNRKTPSRWEIKKLYEVSDVITGTTPSTSHQEYYGGLTPFVTPAELDGEGPVFSASSTLSESGCGQVRLIPADSVMVCCIGSLGKVGFAGIQLATNQQINSVVFDKSKVLPRYGYHYCKTLKPLLIQLAPSTTVPIINKGRFQELEIPVPPLDEQRRIATILDKADAIRRKRQESIRLTEEFLRSTFLEMFGDPVSNPKGWEKVPVNELGNVSTGNTPSREHSEYYGEGIEWIKSDNINTPYHFLTKAKEQLTLDGQKVGRVVPENSTLVTCIAGSPECIGNAAITDRSVAFNQQINAVTPFKGTDPYFLYVQILVAKKLIQGQSTESMKGMVSKGKFETISFVKPPTDLQTEFGKVFKHFLSMNQRTNTSNLQSADLFNSLVHHAFRGEL